MRLHPSLIEIIHRSGLKGGLGLISEPSYWVGMPADSAYLSGRNLFRLWQEIYLLEQMGELPFRASEHFFNWVIDFPLLRPDHFFQTLHKWARFNYGPIQLPSGEDIASDSESAFLGMVATSMFRNNEERERDISGQAKFEFCQLKDQSKIVHWVRG